MRVATYKVGVGIKRQIKDLSDCQSDFLSLNRSHYIDSSKISSIANSLSELNKAKDQSNDDGDRCNGLNDNCNFIQALLVDHIRRSIRKISKWSRAA